MGGGEDDGMGMSNTQRKKAERAEKFGGKFK